MNPVEILFAPLVGQYVWDVRAEYGTIGMEFGPPRLYVRQPRASKPAAPESVRRHFARRTVRPCGQWNLTSGFAFWEASAEGISCSQAGYPDDDAAKVLRIIGGRALSGTRYDLDEERLTLEFDQGGVIIMAPSIPPDDDPEHALWWFVIHQGEGRPELIVYLMQDGRLLTNDDQAYEPASPR